MAHLFVRPWGAIIFQRQIILLRKCSLIIWRRSWSCWVQGAGYLPDSFRTGSNPEKTAQVHFNLSSFYARYLQLVSTANAWNSRAKPCLWKKALFLLEAVPVLKTSSFRFWKHDRSFHFTSWPSEMLCCNYLTLQVLILSIVLIPLI